MAGTGAGGSGGGMTERREEGAFSRTRPPLARTSDMSEDMRDRVETGMGGGCLGSDSEESEDTDWERTESSGDVGGRGGSCLGRGSEGRETSDTCERTESSGGDDRMGGGCRCVDSVDSEASDMRERMESSGVVGMMRGGGRCEWSVDWESEDGLSKDAFK